MRNGFSTAGINSTTLQEALDKIKAQKAAAEKARLLPLTNAEKIPRSDRFISSLSQVHCKQAKVYFKAVNVPSAIFNKASKATVLLEPTQYY